MHGKWYGELMVWATDLILTYFYELAHQLSPSRQQLPLEVHFLCCRKIKTWCVTASKLAASNILNMTVWWLFCCYLVFNPVQTICFKINYYFKWIRFCHLTTYESTRTASVQPLFSRSGIKSCKATSKHSFITVLNRNSTPVEDFSHKKDGVSCQKFWEEPLSVTKILFWGRTLEKCFIPIAKRYRF